MKQVLFIGDATHAEFRSVVTWLREYCDWTACDAPLSAIEWSRHQRQSPDAVVLAEARPGMFQQSDVHLLQATFPDSRLVGLLGAWCEGELRTAPTWQGIRRLYWHQFLPRMARELTPSVMSRMTGGTVLIQACSTEAFLAIADACSAGGFRAVRFLPTGVEVPPFSLAGIWDCQQSVSREAGALAQFVQQLHPTPVLALMGFPRSDDESAVLATGATAVMSKPYALEDLLSEIVRVAHPSRPEHCAC